MPWPSSVTTIAAAAAGTALGDFLVEAGGIAAGAMAVGFTVGLVLAAFAKDLLRARLDQWEIAQRGGTLGALFGVAYALLERMTGG